MQKEPFYRTGYARLLYALRPTPSALRITATLVLTLLLATSRTDAEEADYLVVDDPTALTLLNNYQSDVSGARKAAFPAGTPFRVLEPDETMGDELTRAHRVTYDGSTWYIVLNDDGKPRNGMAAGLERFRNCTVLDDSIQIKRSGSLALQGPSARIQLYQDDIIVRYFKNGTKYYIKQRTGTVAGWSSLSPKSAWGAVKTPEKTVNTDLGDRTRDRIKERIAAANADYKSYTDFFNRRTGDAKSPPRWKLTTTGSGFTCTFNGTDAELETMLRSTQILIGDLTNMILGKPYTVKLHKRTITITADAE